MSRLSYLTAMEDPPQLGIEEGPKSMVTKLRQTGQGAGRTEEMTVQGFRSLLKLGGSQIPNPGQQTEGETSAQPLIQHTKALNNEAILKGSTTVPPTGKMKQMTTV